MPFGRRYRNRIIPAVLVGRAEVCRRRIFFYFKIRRIFGKHKLVVAISRSQGAERYFIISRIFAGLSCKAARNGQAIGRAGVCKFGVGLSVIFPQLAARRYGYLRLGYVQRGGYRLFRYIKYIFLCGAGRVFYILNFHFAGHGLDVIVIAARAFARFNAEFVARCARYCRSARRLPRRICRVPLVACCALGCGKVGRACSVAVSYVIFY